MAAQALDNTPHSFILRDRLGIVYPALGDFYPVFAWLFKVFRRNIAMKAEFL